MPNKESPDLLATLLQKQCTELVCANATGITEELKNAADGRLSISLGFKLQMVANKVYVTTGISYSRKFSDETDGSIELRDPKQPELV